MRAFLYTLTRTVSPGSANGTTTTQGRLESTDVANALPIRGIYHKFPRRFQGETRTRRAQGDDLHFQLLVIFKGRLPVGALRQSTIDIILSKGVVYLSP
jgi:hypothetical protein